MLTLHLDFEESRRQKRSHEPLYYLLRGNINEGDISVPGINSGHYHAVTGKSID
jgi:hypothetical protein